MSFLKWIICFARKQTVNTRPTFIKNITDLHGIMKKEVTYPLLYVQTFMTVIAQFTSPNDSSVLILYCLYIPCMILVSVVHHLSFHFYWLQDLIYSNCKLKSLVYSSRYAAFLMTNNIPLCGKFYGYPHHQNRLGHLLKPPNESCETSVFWNWFQVKGGNLKIPTLITF